jgi:C4-dicarboxylate transporter DctQ subunit
VTGEEADWFAGLPAGPRFWALAGLAVVVALLLRAWIVRGAAGRRFLAVVHAFESGFVAFLLAAMLAFSFLQILLRNLADTGFVWIDPLLRHLLLWIGFTGAGLATRLDRHINVDAVTRALPDRAKHAVRVGTSAVAAIVCMLLADATLRVVREEAGAGTQGFLDVPTWVLQTIMPVMSLLMSYRFAGHVVRSVHDLRTGAPAASPGRTA